MFLCVLFFLLCGMIVWCCVFLDLRLYTFVVSSLFVRSWRAVCSFVLGVSLFVVSVLLMCSAGVVELCVVDGGGFMVWASCRLCCVFLWFCKISF